MTPNRTSEWLKALGGRRFLLTLGSGAVTALLAAAGKISDAVYATVTIATVASFITGDTAQQTLENIKRKPEPVE